MVRMVPATKDYLWGGTRLGELYYPELAGKSVAESWILSAHEDGEGRALTDQGEIPFRAFLNEKGVLAADETFPLLVKLIDAKKPLSVQVHPDDALAQKKGYPCGKTELWYILSAEENAFLYFGVRHPMTRKALRNSAQDGTLEEHLNRLPVRAGDAVLVEAGTIHAIGAGIVLCEVQENANLTYRLYDYKRVGADGKERPLHLDDAVEAATVIPPERLCLSHSAKPVEGGTLDALLRSRFFDLDILMPTSKMQLETESACGTALVVLEGEGEVESGGERFAVRAGDTLYEPERLCRMTLRGAMRVLRVGRR